jgi:hypothetical protein
MANSGDVNLCASLCIVVCGLFIMLICGPIVLSDYNETKGYTQQLCSGEHVEHVHVNDGISYSKATIDTCVIKKSGNHTCLYYVQLYYPPIRHWLLAGAKRADVDRWISSLGSTKSFTCYIQNPGINGSDGISNYFSKIGGWIAMTVIAVVIIVGFICLFVYLYFNN